MPRLKFMVSHIKHFECIIVRECHVDTTETLLTRQTRSRSRTPGSTSCASRRGGRSPTRPRRRRGCTAAWRGTSSGWPGPSPSTSSTCDTLRSRSGPSEKSHFWCHIEMLKKRFSFCTGWLWWSCSRVELTLFSLNQHYVVEKFSIATDGTCWVPGSAWAYGRTGKLGNMMEHPNQIQPNLGARTQERITLFV